MIESGVTFIDPSNAYISGEARIGRYCIIHPGVQVEGTTTIGESCELRAGTRITNSSVGDNVLIKDHCLITDSDISSNCVVGPFAYLRMNSILEVTATVGNFVELKKTRMGKGAKANHLAYLGDSVIGTKTNIGAGTITCNYDGVNKHQTTIGEYAFIGSNSTLVAPIEIGDRAYVGAGSVLTKPVPAESLALGRAHQIVKAGWKPKTGSKKA